MSQMSGRNTRRRPCRPATRLGHIAVLFLTLSCGRTSTAADEAGLPVTDKPLTHEQHIRPIFREHCLDCHGATEEVSRVVAGDGRLFIDFINMPNLYQPLRSIKSYFQYRRAKQQQRKDEKTKYFHYGKLGLRERFERGVGLKMQKIWRVNSAPPLGGKGFRLLFERTLGKLLGPALARTILVEFMNRGKSLRIADEATGEH